MTIAIKTRAVRETAAVFQKQLDRGGLLLWLRAWNEANESTASAILRKHAGSDVHIHDFPAPAS